jgi:Response regulator containing CheY-like receiver, AAA-type ATPase, and DNA-binding domains
MEDARILIVDDQPDFRAMLTVILQRSGFQVFVAADGEEALRLVSEIAPDLILMDVSMPGMGWNRGGPPHPPTHLRSHSLSQRAGRA